MVGGGPAGLATAALLRRPVLVFEEHREVGIPRHCTGLVGKQTMLFYTRLAGERIIGNKYTAITYHVDGSSVTLRWREPVAYRLDRPVLEQRLRDLVEKRGGVVETGVRVERIVPGRGVEARGKLYEGIVVDAEGAVNRLAEALTGRGNKHIYGVQRVVRASLEEGHIHVFFTRLVPRFFAWLVPLSGEEALLGYAAEKPGAVDGAVAAYIESQLGLRLGGVLEMYGGPIPVNPPERLVYRGVYFIGDAVPMLKPFTGGGLYPISVAAPVLAEAIERDDPLAYIHGVKELIEQLGREHRVVSVIRRLGYHRAMRVMVELMRRGLEISVDMYDRHDRVAQRAMGMLLRRPWLLLRLLY